MVIKLVVGGFTLNIISVYAPQVGLDEEVKRLFWEDLDEVVVSIPPAEVIHRRRFQWAHWSASRGYDEVRGGFGFGDGEWWRSLTLGFRKAFGLVVANSCFPKKEEHTW
ncbi:uncharacterized protein LOC132054124 [Lycium ferocissimum]|uniref:uncharacterized protein LOC132054124 n=1 Tax=Lycium ferocissimum TaxID=112874 RepID=UPI002815179F|nr:uncharacterized protein LOC132054124 [Lycium ferocissimum]